MLSTSFSLLERLREPSDHDAWSRFAEFYAPLLLAWVKKRGFQGADAADVVQEILLVVCREMPAFRYDPSRRFRGWLRTIAVNKANEFHRRKARDRPSPQSEVAALLAAEDEGFWEDEYRQFLMARAIDLVRTSFEEKTWRAALESLLNQRPARDVARELGMTEAAVYQSRSRVLRHLRRELSGLWE